MKLTFVKQSALHILRDIRRGSLDRSLAFRCEMISPDPSPGLRWSRKRLEALGSQVGLVPEMTRRYHVCAPDKSSRLQMSCVSNTIYGTCLPSGAFVDLGDGIASSGAELLFVEMAAQMTEAGHLMLGHELCGSFVRDSDDPINGEVRIGVAPVTSVERIGEFLGHVKHVRGLERARQTLELLSDNAWSPTESVVATMAALPVASFGYGLTPLVLNRRYSTPERLTASTRSGSRVPDIMFGDTGVGINYDGTVHLDLEAVADAGRSAALNPEDPQFELMLKRVIREVRAKAVDDIRRNRELAADGLVVYPVVKEDLYEPGGLDRVMLQVITSIEERTGHELVIQRRALGNATLKKRRQRLLRSLLPGVRGGVTDGVLLQCDRGGNYAYAAIGF